MQLAAMMASAEGLPPWEETLAWEATGVWALASRLLKLGHPQIPSSGFSSIFDIGDR
jgi:hypothetical protein